MNETAAWLTTNGVQTSPAGLVQASVAALLTVAALGLGVLAGRSLGVWLSDFWKQHADGQGELVRGRLCAIIRHGSAALLLAILSVGHSWEPLSDGLIGFALAAAAARAVIEVLRGLSMPRWTCWAVAAVVFVALFSHNVGGLRPIRHTLDLIGFDIGSRRFSLLALILILVTSVALFAAVRLANRLIAHGFSRATSLDPTQKLLGQKLASIAVLILAFFVGIDLLDINLTAFAVFSGAFGLAIGFGLQKTIGNLIAGIILLMDRSIKPGDVIAVGDSFGWVNKIGVRAVSIVTRDGKEHLIPNENLMTQEVENWSYTDPNVRVRIPVTVAYDCDLKLAQQLMAQAATDSPRVLDTPSFTIRLEAFGESGVEHEILVWINDPQGGVGNVRSDVLNRLWWLFKENNIRVAMPQREVRVTDLRSA